MHSASTAAWAAAHTARRAQARLEMNQEQATAAAAQLPHIVTYTHAVAGLRSSRSRSPPAVRAVGRGLAATLDAPAGGRAARAGRERVGTDHFAAGASNEGDCEFDRQMAQAKSETASTSRRAALAAAAPAQETPVATAAVAAAALHRAELESAARVTEALVIMCGREAVQRAGGAAGAQENWPSLYARAKVIDEAEDRRRGHGRGDQRRPR